MVLNSNPLPNGARKKSWTGCYHQCPKPAECRGLKIFIENDIHKPPQFFIRVLVVMLRLPDGVMVMD